MGGSVGVFELSQSARLLILIDRARTRTKPKQAVMRLMVSHGWSKRSPTTDTPQGERDFGVWSKNSQTPKDEGTRFSDLVLHGRDLYGHIYPGTSIFLSETGFTKF